MKKSGTRILFGTLLVWIIGYLVWCARPFFMRPKLAFDSDVSRQEQIMIEDWYAGGSGPTPMEFSWPHFLSLLQDPWKPNAGTASVKHFGPREIAVFHDAKGWSFRLRHGEWTYVNSYDFRAAASKSSQAFADAWIDFATGNGE